MKLRASIGNSGVSCWAPAHLVDIAIFCNSDETHGHAASYFADVKLRR